MTKKATTEKASEPAAKPARATLTKAQRVAIYEAAGGKCYVLGVELKPLEPWHVEDGVLLSPEAKRLKGGRSLDELRGYLADRRTKANDAVTDAELAYDKAQLECEELAKTIGHLFDGDGAVKFAGEAKG